MKHLNTNITLYKEKDNFRVKKKKKIKTWIGKVTKKEGYRIEQINYFLVSDKTLLDLNKSQLNHNYYTDIITFDMGEEEGVVEADLYISYDRVKDNAKVFHVKHIEEMKRVMIHGVLHIMGYKDKSQADIQAMRNKEDSSLRLYKKING